VGRAAEEGFGCVCDRHCDGCIVGSWCWWKEEERNRMEASNAFCAQLKPKIKAISKAKKGPV
jgi:hypothetical protein